MSLYPNILVPVDGSPTAERGLQEAIALARLLGSRLRLIHVVDDFPMLVEMSTVSSFDANLQKMRQYGESVLAKAFARASMADVEADTVLIDVTQGRVADVIVAEAAKQACDLVVMGTHGRRGFSRLALGSDAERVVRASPAPVLLVRSKQQ